ncbi:MAG: glycosyltransferase family 2 protein [Lachnospiraceae bacterium]|nr:glycosyltransferase family 2 protein [Lachnospiraceae bacterium]
MSIKVSVIVPVYNAEKYLEECLESLIHQTMLPEEMEILAVDDCSTDNSRAILERFAGNYPQIRILQTPRNAGPGGARNVGLNMAQGEYIGFVDSDDAAVATMYEHMYDTAVKGNYDIVDTGVYYQGKDLAMVHTADEDTEDQNDEKRSHNIVSGGYLMTRIFRRSFWEGSGLRFREHVILEDMESLMYLNATARRIGNLKEINYVYRNTDGSASKERQFERYHGHAIRAMEAVYERMYVLPYYRGIQDAVEYTIVQLYIYALTNCLLQKGRVSSDIILQRMKELRDVKKTCVKKNYDTVYISNKLQKADIDIGKLNDTDPEQLLSLVKTQ